MMDLFCFILGKKLPLAAFEKHACNQRGHAARSGGRARDHSGSRKTKWTHTILLPAGLAFFPA